MLDKPIDYTSKTDQLDVLAIIQWFFKQESCKFNTLKFIEKLWENGHADKSFQPQIISEALNSKFLSPEILQICIFYPCKLGEHSPFRIEYSNSVVRVGFSKMVTELIKNPSKLLAHCADVLIEMSMLKSLDSQNMSGILFSQIESKI